MVVNNAVSWALETAADGNRDLFCIKYGQRENVGMNNYIRKKKL